MNFQKKKMAVEWADKKDISIPKRKLKSPKISKLLSGVSWQIIIQSYGLRVNEL